MKKVYIIHRWSGSPESDWYPWLAEEIEKTGANVTRLATPHPDEPTIEDSVQMMKDAVESPDANTYFVGHSIGCQTILRYMETFDSPVGGAVLVAPWLHLQGLEGDEEKEIAKPWLESPIDFEKVRANVPRVAAIFSSNDMYVPQSDVALFKERLGAEVLMLENAGHITDGSGFTQLPEARDALLEMMKL